MTIRGFFGKPRLTLLARWRWWWMVVWLRLVSGGKVDFGAINAKSRRSPLQQHQDGGENQKKLNKFAESTLWGEHNGNFELLLLKLREFSPTAQRNKTFWLRIHYIRCDFAIFQCQICVWRGFCWRFLNFSMWLCKISNVKFWFFWKKGSFLFGTNCVGNFEKLSKTTIFFWKFKGYDL